MMVPQFEPDTWVTHRDSPSWQLLESRVLPKYDERIEGIAPTEEAEEPESTEDKMEA